MFSFEQEFTFRHSQQVNAIDRLGSHQEFDPNKASSNREFNRLMLNPNSALSIAVSTDPALVASMLRAVD